MKSRFNRFLGIILSVLLVLTMIPTLSFADDEAIVPKSGKFTVDGKEFILIDTEPQEVNGGKYYRVLSTDYVSYTWRKAHFQLYYLTEADAQTDGDIPVEIHLTNYDTGDGDSIQSYVDKFSPFEGYMISPETTWDLYNNGTKRMYFKGNVLIPSNGVYSYLYANGDKVKMGADDNFLPTSDIAYFGYWAMFGAKSDGSVSPDNPDLNSNNDSKGSSLAGGTWYFMTYITKDFFDENTIDVDDKLGEKVIDFFNANYTKGDLRRIGYTDAETVFFGHEPAVEPVTGVELNKNSTVINLFKSEQLIATVLPAYMAANENVTWTSSNPDSVIVDENGLVTAVAPGEATITVTTEEGGFTATCDVDVNVVALNRLRLDKTSAKIYTGDTLKLTPVYDPVDASYTDVEWSTSDASIATVVDGVVTAHTSGNATITATYKADPTKTAKCSIAIYDYKADFKSSDLSAFIVRYFGMISVDMTLMTKNNAEQMALAKAAINVDKFTSDALGNEINKQLATQLVSATTTATDAEKAISDYNKYIGLEFDGWLDDVKSESKPAIYQTIADGTFASAEKLIETYNKAVIVAQINDVAFSAEIQGILEKYSEYVKKYGINLSAYETLIDTDFADSLLGTYANWEAFASAYKSAIITYTPDEGDSDGGSGGFGGGSGGGKGGGTVLVQFTPEVDNALLPQVTPEASKAIFTDLDDAKWAIEYIEPLAKLGHINGKTENKFCPNDNIKREEVVKILVSALGLDTSDVKASFTDVNAGAWYAPYLAAAKENGIINGNPDGSFGVNDNITREELATMIYRASKLLASATDVQFADEAQIADYAKEAVSTLVAAGVINGKGDNNFAPKANATRAEASKIIYLAIIGK